MYYIHVIYLKMLKVDSTSFYHECQAKTLEEFLEKKSSCTGDERGRTAADLSGEEEAPVIGL